MRWQTNAGAKLDGKKDADEDNHLPIPRSGAEAIDLEEVQMDGAASAADSGYWIDYGKAEPGCKLCEYKGSGSGTQCGFHGWMFGLDEKLEWVGAHQAGVSSGNGEG